MTEWEHEFEDIDPEDSAGLKGELAYRGSTGWTLVTVVSLPRQPEWRHYFTRRAET
jgi:hypothetical protein